LLSRFDIVPSPAASICAQVRAADSRPAGSSPQLRAAIVEQSRRGLRLQILLRGALAVFLIVTVTIVSPALNATACYVVAGAYAAWVASTAAWGWRGDGMALRMVWVVLLVDLAALGTLTVLAGASARESWTAEVLVNGFLLVPVLAATQLGPRIGAAILAPTICVYLAVSIATRAANAEPWSSVGLRAGVLVGISIGCVALSWIQRERVLRIGHLLEDRTELIGQVMSTEDRERRALAEQLHDGALQYLLGARHDLEDAREHAEPEAFARLELALTESSRLLRSTVAELHPAVLEHAGLARALRLLADSAATGGRPAIAVELDGWSDELRTPVDGLLYAAARELLSNVVKHADANSATITLSHQHGRARLVVADDGRGIDEAAAEHSLASGHIGLASHRARIEAAGGTLTVGGASGSGTIALVELPYTPLDGG
jgi:two-component system NarL family sensor kinase